MQTKQDIDLTNTINQLQENLNEAFNRQKTEVEDLKNTVRKILNLEDVIIEVSAFLIGFVPIYGNFISLPVLVKSLYEKRHDQQIAKMDLYKKEKNIINLLLKTHEK